MSQEQYHLDFPLPPEVLYDILLLLPFESILACKRISKKCKNLVNHPDFPKKYRPDRSLILSIDQDNVYCILLSHINNRKGFPSHTVHRLPITLESQPNSGNHELLLGQFNGIACVKASNGYFHLYNLFTGVSHTVKDAPQRNRSNFWIYYGFGYDLHDDDYKIMVVCDYKIQKEERDRQNEKMTLFWVHSSKIGTWKKYDGFPYARYVRNYFAKRSYFFNGALHSVVAKRESAGIPQKPVILSCDLHTCSFGEISVPDDYRPTFYYQDCDFFTEVQGRLCFSYRIANVHLMEVYGDDGCWVKWVSIKDPSVMPISLHLVHSNWKLCSESCHLVDGTKVVLVVFSDRFLWCDPANNKVQVVHMTNWLKNQRERVRVKTGQSTLP